MSEQLNNSCLAPVHWKERLHDCATMRQTSPDPCLWDSDVAEVYGVETKWINEAVKNNSDKFPTGYNLDLSDESWESLRSKFSTLNGTNRGKYRNDHRIKFFSAQIQAHRKKEKSMSEQLNQLCLVQT